MLLTIYFLNHSRSYFEFLFYFNFPYYTILATHTFDSQWHDKFAPSQHERDLVTNAE